MKIKINPLEPDIFDKYPFYVQEYTPQGTVTLFKKGDICHSREIPRTKLSLEYGKAFWSTDKTYINYELNYFYTLYPDFWFAYDNEEEMITNYFDLMLKGK